MYTRMSRNWTFPTAILSGLVLAVVTCSQADAQFFPSIINHYSGPAGQAVGYAQARKIRAEAEAAELELESARARTFFEKRDMNDRAREAERYRRQNAKVEALIERTAMLKKHEQTVPEYHRALDAVRTLKLDRARAQAARFGPGRPSVDELNRSTGKITWPAGLMGENYLVHRMTLSELFAQRGAQIGDRYELDYEIQRAVRHMQSDMKRHIRRMPPDHYGRAKSFLNRLAYETRFDPPSRHTHQVAGR